MIPEKFLTRLMGRTEVEDALERLDTLTREETLMAVTRNLVVTHHVDDNVMAVKGIVDNIDGNVEAIKEVIRDIGGSVEVSKDVISNVDGNVKGTMELAENIDDNVKATKALTEDVGGNVNVIEGVARSVDHNVKASKNGTHRFLFIFTCSDPSRFVTKTAIEQLKRSLHPDGAIIWPSTLKHIYRDAAAESASNMALGSKSVHQSQYRMQNSAWRNRNVVYPKQDISRLEEEWFLVVGPWQSYAPP